MNDSTVSNDRAAQQGGSERRALLVLGMHRSGTSAMSRVLSLLGADLPSRTVGPDKANTTGYWEPPELYRLHDQMLARASSRWDDWRPLNRAALDEYDVIGLTHALLEFQTREFRDSRLFVIKDPRICRFVPLWLEVLKRFAATPYAVIPFRHPLAVARSLHARDGFTFAKSYLVWLRHVIDAELASRQMPRTFVDYDRLLTDWRAQVKRMADELGITWPTAVPQVEDAIDRFLSVELRHHAAARGELEGNQNVVSWIRRAYAALETFTQSGDCEAARREMDQVRAEFDNACLAFGEVWREEREDVARETLAPLGVAFSRTIDGQLRDIGERLNSLNDGLEEVRDRVQTTELPWSLLQQGVERQQQTIQNIQARAEEAHRLAGLSVEATSASDVQIRQLAEDAQRRDAAVTASAGNIADRQEAIQRLVEDQARRLEDLAAAVAAAERRAEEHAQTRAGRQDDVERLVADQARRLEDLAAAVAAAERRAEEHAQTRAGRQEHLARLVEAQDRRVGALESAMTTTERQSSEHSQAIRQVDAQAAKLARLQFGLDGAISRIDAITAGTVSSRFGSAGQRLRKRLRDAGRVVERAVRKLRKTFGRVSGLDGLQASLARRRLRRECREIRSSGLFDAPWYLHEYPDVAANGIDPVMHYMTHGVSEGRCPNPLFHTRWYLEQYPDVVAALGNPLLHYLRHGAAEGRDPSPLFQTRAYLAAHPELRGSGRNPLAHFLQQADPTARGGSTAIGREPPQAAGAEHEYPCQESPFQEPGPAAAGPNAGDARSVDLAYTPLVSVVVPVYDTPPVFLEKMIQSVERQWYGNWELCLVDDASPAPHVRPLLDRAAARDPRIRVTSRTSNGNISAATNTGFEMARGEFIALLDHDDELTDDALLEVVRLLNEDPETDVVYTDQDKIDTEGRRSEPFHKPAWSPAYLQSVMYVGHLLVVRASLLEKTGGCDSAFDGVQDFELMLRLGEATKRIRHLPRILYHWRKIPGSIASDLGAKQGIVDLQRKAVQAQLDRLGMPAVATTNGTAHRVRLEPRGRATEPLISILIPSKDHPELIGPCLKSLFGNTAYGTFEVIVGDNETSDPDALRILEQYPVTRVPLAGPFRFAAFNNRMAEHARGDYLLLLNNDTEIVQPNWLDTLLLYAEQDDVGAVGPMLLYGDGTVQHAGVILGPRGTADHVMRGFPGDSDGYAGSLQAAREVTAVTGACLLVRRDHYLACGGLNEAFGRHYEDVDFCLRLRRRGLRNVFVGSVRLLHHESKSRGSYYDFTDRVLLLDHWESWIRRGDPYYNPAFDPERVDYSVRLT
jgi:GT2 family glycosyltransferase